MGCLMFKVFCCTLLVTYTVGQNANSGFFWHVTDMHFDPTYSTSSAGLSCNDATLPSYGMYGDFACDPPYALIQSALNAMQDIEPNPDFIVWTGDDAPHIWDDDILNPAVVESIVFNLTDAILETFPGQQVYAALGNHDWSPKSQLPPKPHPKYTAVADKWDSWLREEQAKSTFEKGAYYTLTHESLRIVVLNTNLYYYSNALTKAMPDPANQLQWLDDTLTAAAEADEKVILIAHISPGLFEKHRFYYWYYPFFNDVFLALLEKHQHVIGSMHYGHHHTDTFRVLYNSTGHAYQSFLLAPAVAPWETTLDGVMGGPGNNPSIRLVQYDKTTGEVEDIHQYYLHLDEANALGQDEWILEYKGTEYYGQPDMRTQSLHNIAQQLWDDDDLFTKYYLANGVRYDPDETWDEETRIVHVCSMIHSHYDDYQACYDEKMGEIGAASSFNLSHTIALLCSIIGLFHGLIQ